MVIFKGSTASGQLGRSQKGKAALTSLSLSLSLLPSKVFVIISSFIKSLCLLLGYASQLRQIHKNNITSSRVVPFVMKSTNKNK